MAMRHPMRWQDVCDELKRDWEETTLARSRPWDEAQDDVRFGWEQGIGSRYRDATFADIEEELQARWEENYPHAKFEDWRQLKEAVKLGFDRAKAA